MAISLGIYPIFRQTQVESDVFEFSYSYGSYGMYDDSSI